MDDNGWISSAGKSTNELHFWEQMLKYFLFLTILLEKPYSFWYRKKRTYMEEKLHHIWAELPLEN
jgi:hypothetical protein